jgi:hypothetical protein
MDAIVTNNNFDFWTPEENDLVQIRKKFALAIVFGDDQTVETSLYEYDPMLKEILDLSIDMINSADGYLPYDLIEFNVEKQYIVIRRNLKYTVEYVGQYTTNEEAINIIKTDQLNLNAKHSTEYEYAVVNLEHTTPHFFGKGKLVKRNHTRPGLFYSGTTSDRIEF